MSTRELERVEVMGRVAKEEVKLMDAAAMLQPLLPFCRMRRHKRLTCGNSTAVWLLHPSTSLPL